MYDELIKRLRELPHLLFVNLHGYEDVVYKAADAIEELSKSIDDANEANMTLCPFDPFHVERRADEYISCRVERKADEQVEQLSPWDVIPHWIPVAERLPEDEQDVLAYKDDGIESRIIPCNYSHSVWFDCLFDREADHVTHWMPLPEPPKGD